MTEASNLTVLAVCGDPGGSMAVAPALEALRAEGRVNVNALAYRHACDQWTKRGLAFEQMDGDIAQDTIDRWLQTPGTALLLVGTSHNEIGLEKRFTIRARKLGIPSLALLDFWSNYALRFSDDGTDLVGLPDQIAVMDDWAVKDMAAAGFEPSRLVITGQPAFDELPEWRSNNTAEKRNAVRAALGVKPDGLLVMFASQPLAQQFGTDSSNPLYPGYHEGPVLESVIESLDGLARDSGRQIVLAVHPHPQEDLAPFLQVTDPSITGRSVDVKLSTSGEIRNMVMSVDLLIGMNTVLLIEACYLGCITVSLQPGLTMPDTIQTNWLGYSYPAYTEEEIGPVLERMLLNKNARSAALTRLEELRLETSATQQVVSLVYRTLGLEEGQESYA